MLIQDSGFRTKMLPRDLLHRRAEGSFANMQTIHFKGKNEVCELSSTHCLETSRPKQEERRVAEACKSTNITFGEIPLISGGLSRAGPGKILLRCLITRSASQSVAGLLSSVRE